MIDAEFLVNQAIVEILATYDVSVSVARKAKSLRKWGRNDNLGTAAQTVWETGGTEALPSDNLIDRAVSTNAADSAVIGYEYHDFGPEGLVFGVGQFILNGTTPVVLPGHGRISRAFVVSGTLAGVLTIYQSGTADVHITVSGLLGESQSYKGATSTSNRDWILIKSATYSIAKKASATVDFFIEQAPVGGVFRPIAGIISLNSSGQSTFQDNMKPYHIVPPNHDIRVRAVASNTGVQVSGRFDALLAIDRAQI